MVQRKGREPAQDVGKVPNQDGRATASAPLAEPGIVSGDRMGPSPGRSPTRTSALVTFRGGLCGRGESRVAGAERSGAPEGTAEATLSGAPLRSAPATRGAPLHRDSPELELARSARRWTGMDDRREGGARR